jgi:hypothetical protein
MRRVGLTKVPDDRRKDSRLSASTAGQYRGASRSLPDQGLKGNPN